MNAVHQKIRSGAQKVVGGLKGVSDLVSAHQTFIGRKVSGNRKKLAGSRAELRRSSIRKQTSKSPQKVEHLGLLQKIRPELAPQQSERQISKLEMLSPKEQCAQLGCQLGKMRRPMQHPTPTVGRWAIPIIGEHPTSVLGQQPKSMSGHHPIPMSGKQPIPMLGHPPTLMLGEDDRNIRRHAVSTALPPSHVGIGADGLPQRYPPENAPTRAVPPG